MERIRLSRRDFLRGAGATGVAAAGALMFPCAEAAFAEEGATVDVEGASLYSKALGDDASLLPMRKAACPGPRGPIAFEDRDIADSEIASTEECEVLIIGAGIGGLMGSLKAAEEGAQTITLEKMTEGRSAWESFGAVGPGSKRSRVSRSTPPSCETGYTARLTGASIPARSRRM